MPPKKAKTTVTLNDLPKGPRHLIAEYTQGQPSDWTAAAREALKQKKEKQAKGEPIPRDITVQRGPVTTIFRSNQVTEQMVERHEKDDYTSHMRKMAWLWEDESGLSGDI